LADENFLFINDKASNIVIIRCNTNLNIIKENRCVYVDGTLKYCSKFFYRMFTIHVLHNRHYLSLIYCYLPNKTSITYRKAFSVLCKHLYPEVFSIDFEEAIHSALRKTWLSINIKGCRFYLGQSWWPMIQSMGLASEFRDKDSWIGRALKHLFSLPYLSKSEFIEVCFTDDLMDIKLKYDKVDKVFDYIFENYIMAEVVSLLKCGLSDHFLFLWPQMDVKRSTVNSTKKFYTSRPNIFKVYLLTY
jgi:hypothetical protein